MCVCVYTVSPGLGKNQSLYPSQVLKLGEGLVSLAEVGKSFAFSLYIYRDVYQIDAKSSSSRYMPAWYAVPILLDFFFFLFFAPSAELLFGTSIYSPAWEEERSLPSLSTTACIRRRRKTSELTRGRSEEDNLCSDFIIRTRARLKGGQVILLLFFSLPFYWRKTHSISSESLGIEVCLFMRPWKRKRRTTRSLRMSGDASRLTSWWFFACLVKSR